MIKSKWEGGNYCFLSNMHCTLGKSNLVHVRFPNTHTGTNVISHESADNPTKTEPNCIHTYYRYTDCMIIAISV